MEKFQRLLRRNFFVVLIGLWRLFGVWRRGERLWCCSNENRRLEERIGAEDRNAKVNACNAQDGLDEWVKLVI